MPAWLLDLISKQSLVDLTFIVWVLILNLWLSKQQAAERIDLLDLITGDNDRLSGTKCAKVTALIVSTWGFVHLVMVDKLTDWYMGLYIAVWAGSEVGAKLVAAKYEAPKREKHDET